MKRLILIFIMTFGLLPSTSASELGIQAVGEKLNINFQTIDSKFGEMETLILRENAYQDYISNLQSITEEIDSKVIKFKLMLNSKNLPLADIQKRIDELESFNKNVIQIQNELRSIEAVTYPDPISLANSLSATVSQIRPVIVDLKFPLSLYGKPSPESYNPNNKQVLITWEMTVKSKSLINQIGIVTPPDFSGIWGNYESPQNLDQTTTSKNQPDKERPHLMLAERLFKDGWIYETYVGRQWSNFDKDWKNGNAFNTIQVWAATGKDNFSYTCRRYLSDNYATFDYLTEGCTRDSNPSSPVPQISQSQDALDNAINQKILLTSQNRQKYENYLGKLRSIHRIEDSTITALELLLSKHQILLSEVNIFEKQQNDRLAQLDALRIKSASNSSINKKTSITCIKGKLTKKVTAAKPKCPSGYKVKK